jgi:hypothetical protein
VRKPIYLLSASIVLGIMSPLMVNPTPDMSAVVFAWFYWLPGLVNHWLSPEDDAAFMALAMARVHGAVLDRLWLGRGCTAGRSIGDGLMRPHKHRGGLMCPKD